MTRREIVTIIILVAMDVLFVGAVFAAFHWNYPPEVKTTLLTVFTGWNGALGLALKSGDGVKSSPQDSSPPTR